MFSVRYVLKKKYCIRVIFYTQIVSQNIDRSIPDNIYQSVWEHFGVYNDHTEKNN